MKQHDYKEQIENVMLINTKNKTIWEKNTTFVSLSLLNKYLFNFEIGQFQSHFERLFVYTSVPSGWTAA